MPLWNNFPWTNTHEINLDWIIKKMKNLSKWATDIEVSAVRGEEAGVTVVSDVDEGKLDINFTLPKGDKGDTGIQGPKGDKGDTGDTGPKGDKGDTGDTVYTVQIAAFSTLPQTINDSNITADMIVVGEPILSNPSAQTSEWNIATANGSFTITGSISGLTTLSLSFAKSNM